MLPHTAFGERWRLGEEDLWVTNIKRLVIPYKHILEASGAREVPVGA
jgi:hypothetical protein